MSRFYNQRFKSTAALNPWWARIPKPLTAPDPLADMPEREPPTPAEIDELARLDDAKRFKGSPHEL